MSAKERFLQLQALYRAGQFYAAADALTVALRVTPKDPNLLHLMAQVAEAQGDVARAVMFYRRALAAHAHWPEAHFNLARALSLQGALTEATALATDLTQQYPDLPQAWEALAKFRQQAGDYPAAVKAWEKVIALAPEQMEWRAQYLLLLRQICDWRPVAADIGSLPPQAATVLSDDPDLQKKSAVRYAAEKFGAITNAPPAPPVHGARKIRLGYLSSDFHAHATAYLIAELFSLHDRSKFEIFTYSYGVEDHSPIRKRIKEQSEHFATLNKLTAAAAAQRIREDGLDILVDLKGYTRGARPEILAQRPAAVQMHWLGYPGTMGAPFIDYFIGDAVTIPAGSEKAFTEKIIRLPHSYQINDRQRVIDRAQSRASYHLPQSGLVFASFNQSYKITPEHFALWCDVLREVPGSVLWLLESNKYAAENLRNTAAAKGINAARLIFAGPVPLAEHLARYAHVDIALDTFPVGGHTTTSDALWAGVPVVTLAGRSFVSRVAASLLTAAKLPQLVTETPEAYRSMILALARDPVRLAGIEEHLRADRLSLPLFDTPRFVRDFEAALIKINGGSV